MVVELGRLAEGNIGNERGIVVYGHVIDVKYPEGQEIGGGERQETVWIERRQGRPLVLESTMLNHRSKGYHQTPTRPTMGNTWSCFLRLWFAPWYWQPTAGWFR